MSGFFLRVHFILIFVPLHHYKPFFCQNTMKKIAVSLAIVLAASSCEKENLSAYKDIVSGEWEYIRNVGFIVPVPPLPAGNGKIIAIGTNGSFERRSHDTVLFSGRYSLDKRKDCYGEEARVFINTNDNSFTNNFTINRIGDSLIIGSPNCFMDGGITIYRKL